MLGKIVYINNNVVHVATTSKLVTNIINMHIVFEDGNRIIIGEVEDMSTDLLKIRFLGEIINGNFIGGIILKPTMSASVRMIKKEELDLILGFNEFGHFNVGYSPLYGNYPIMIKINNLFNGHLAILGNSGSGKSCGVARLLQNIFNSPNFIPFKSNIIIFDTYGEYHNSFKNLNEINPNFNFKYYTTDESDTVGEKIKIPLWLLDTNDLAILLSATSHSQLTIIEEALKIVNIFASDNELADKYKNHLIAKAIMNIIFTNQSASSKRNDIFNIFSSCSTNEFNLNATVQGAGYTRKFKDCFLIDNTDRFNESILINEYVTSFIDENLDSININTISQYSLHDLEKALNFTLISDGFFRNQNVYEVAITLKVRLHSLINSKYAKYFDVKNFFRLDNYIASIVSKNNLKAQIINYNLEDIDDWFAKFITKTITKLLFDFTKNLTNRASMPFHIFIEEAHRYVQKDGDNFLIGYNIFERVAKEGRKYGLILNLISQRPVELSDTVMAQMANFMIFKLSHPADIEYVEKIIPNMSEEIIQKQKSLQPGTCVAFGKAFKIPMIIKMEMPNPEPASGNCDVVSNWIVK